MDTDYADDRAFLANIPAQAESLLHSLEQAVENMNANKTEYMCFNWEAISTLNGGLLKLVGNFMYLGSSVSSTENDVNIHLAKAWTAIDRQLII